MIQIISIGERGLVVSFSKNDLIDIKNGGTLHGELVGEGGKTKIMFMRDSTFQDMQRKFNKSLAEATAAEKSKREVEGVAGDSQALGQAIGTEEETAQ